MARGENGLFKSVFSQKIELKINNPCMKSVVNGDGSFVIESMKVPIGQSLLTLILPGPTNTVSALYGNGYDKCGELTYLWLDANGKQFSSEWFKGEANSESNFVDSLTLVLHSEPNGTDLHDQVTLSIRLDDYPSSTPATFKISLTYRECFPLVFSVPKIEDLKLKVGTRGPVIDYFFDQYPCKWNQTYTIFIVTPLGKTSVLP